MSIGGTQQRDPWFNITDRIHIGNDAAELHFRDEQHYSYGYLFRTSMKRTIGNAPMRGMGLRIGIDARLMADPSTGIVHYVSELCRELAQLLPQADVFLYAPWRIVMPVESPKWHMKIDPWSKLFEHTNKLWITRHAWMLLRARTLACRDKINVFWATDAPFIPYLPSNVRVVATVYDLRYRIAPETQRTTTLYMRRLLERRHSRPDALLVISHGTGAKLKQFLGYEATAVVRPAASTTFYRRNEREIDRVIGEYGIRRPYLLSIANSAATPHKNLEQLVRVFGELQREGFLDNHILVLGGPNSKRFLANFNRKLAKANINVVAVGYIEGSHLPALYSGAEALVFPSLYEGFGLPVLEARACQTRIVATDIQEIREAGGDRATYVQPHAAGIREGIMTSLATERPTHTDDLWTWRSSAEVLADALDPQ